MILEIAGGILLLILLLVFLRQIVGVAALVVIGIALLISAAIFLPDAWPPVLGIGAFFVVMMTNYKWKLHRQAEAERQARQAKAAAAAAELAEKEARKAKRDKLAESLCNMSAEQLAAAYDEIGGTEYYYQEIEDVVYPRTKAEGVARWIGDKSDGLAVVKVINSCKTRHLGFVSGHHTEIHGMKCWFADDKPWRARGKAIAEGSIYDATPEEHKRNVEAYLERMRTKRKEVEAEAAAEVMDAIRNQGG